MSRSGPRIVFLIDRYQGDNEEPTNNKIIANLNLSCMRILSYFKHCYCRSQSGGKSSLLWGYKFFNSSKRQSLHYKQYQFLDYAVHNFDKFEDALFEGIESDSTTLPKEIRPGERLRVALTEIITDFHWDQPELFSPSNSVRESDCGGNFLFLFTKLSGSWNDDRCPYFDENYQDSKGFVKCLFPNVLYNKFVKHLKIRLHWLDTDSYINRTHQTGSTDQRTLIQNAMQSIGGYYIEMVYLSSWWIWSGEQKLNKSTKKGRNIHVDVTSVSCLMRGLLDHQHRHVSTPTQYTIRYHNNEAAVISLSPISHSIKTVDEHRDLSIHVLDTVSLKSIDLNMLSYETGYFYVINRSSLKSNYKNLFHPLLSSGKGLRIDFIPAHSNTSQQALMVPASAFGGTVIVLSKAYFEKSGAKCDRKNKKEVDAGNELERQLCRHFDSKDSEFGMSLVNIIDSWFLLNPKLGFPASVKDILTKLSDRSVKKKKREEASKPLITYMKGLYGKSETKNLTKRLSHSKISLKKQSPTTGRQRLVEFRNRQIVKPTPEVCEKTEKEAQTNDMKSALPLRGISFEDDLQHEYKTILGEPDLCYHRVGCMVENVMAHFKTLNSESYVECSLSLLRSQILKSVEDIRDKNVDNPKEILIREYLLQVHLYFEVVDRLQPTDNEVILNTVVSFLRTVLFEESTLFVSKHLNEKVLTRFPKLKSFLQKLYDDLMLVFPDGSTESDVSSEGEEESSVKSVETHSVVSHCSAEHSPYSLQPAKRTLRRIPSIVGDGSKKVIAVQGKKSNTYANKKKKSDKSSADSSEKVVKRTLFSQDAPTTTNIMTTPKSRRRKSESALKKQVPDTPEGQQLNNMIWKKLERKRRHSCFDKNMVTIEESPLKEIASPIKRKSSFYRSNSFNCHTSPRRFYTLKRHPTMAAGRCTKESIELNQSTESGRTVGNDEVCSSVSATPIEVKLRRRSTLFSNFETEDSEEEVEEEGNENLAENICDDVDEKSAAFRRKIFDSTPVKEKPSEDFTFKLFGTEEKESKRRKISPEEEESVGQTKTEENPVFMSATTLDWLTEIEKEQSKTPTNFHDAFASMFSDTTTPPVSGKPSPAIVKAGNESIRVSPCVSATSIELLENAPIISPVIQRKVSRRKGRLLNL